MVACRDRRILYILPNKEHDCRASGENHGVVKKDGAEEEKHNPKNSGSGGQNIYHWLLILINKCVSFYHSAIEYTLDLHFWQYR